MRIHSDHAVPAAAPESGAGAEQASLLQRRIEALEQAVQARDDFLAIAAHELRSPLNTLAMRLAYLERLASLESTQPAQLLAEIRRARASADRYARRAAVLLDVARLNSGTLQVQRTPVAIPELVRAVVEAHADEAALRGVALDVRVETTRSGHWDEHMVEQVLSNLLHNALKYGNGAPIHLQVREEGGCALFVVADEGPGIPPEHRARLFEKFERLVAGGAPRSGYGLGLWIVRSMVEAHGGRIEIDGGEGGGSVFRVTLPLQE